VAHTLNSRARATYARVKAETRGRAARAATESERQLPPIKRSVRHHPLTSPDLDLSRRLKYRLKVAPLDDQSFYSFRLAKGELVLTINQEHPFFARIYRPLQQSASSREKFPVECLLLALARMEAGALTTTQRHWYQKGRRTLSNVLAAFLRG